MSPDGSTVVSPDFLRELDNARRRLDVLEEANRAIQGLVDRIGCLSAYSEGLERCGSPEEVADLLLEEAQSIVPSEMLLLALQANGDGGVQPFRLVSPPASAPPLRQEFEGQHAAGMGRWTMEAHRPAMVAAHNLGGHLVLVPLVTSRRPVGLLLLGSTLPAEVITQEQLTLMAVAARQAAERFENLHLAAVPRQQNLALQAAAEAAQAHRIADLGLLVEAARTVSGPLDQSRSCRCSPRRRVAISTSGSCRSRW